MNREEIKWRGADAVRLSGGGYEAIILPRWGANCVSLKHIASDTELLRVPMDAKELQNSPCVFGLPLLFPPNRIENGVFSFEGRKYRYPINEPECNNHIHGRLANAQFIWDGEAFVFCADTEKPYLDYPHAFTLKRRYKLDEEGLRHQICITNDSDTDMPVGVGIHAALNCPEGSRLRMMAMREWMLNERHLPTGEVTEESSLLYQLSVIGIAPDLQPLSHLLDILPGSEIHLETPKGTVVCETDERFHFVMLWNQDGKKGFVCP